MSTAGNLGQLTRNSIYTSTLAVVQSSRASFFESIVTGTATNADYMVPALVLPTDVVQLLDVSVADVNGRLQPLRCQELHELANGYPVYSYALVGSSLYLNLFLERPINIQVRALLVPTVPTADDALIGLPKPVQPAIAHGAASLLCLSYVDDANAAAQHKRTADELTLMLRQQFGITRGRSYSMANNNQGYRGTRGYA